jgi:gp16 family phage-associated protein
MDADLAKTQGRLRTPQEVKADLLAQGKNLSVWAKENGFSPRMVQGVLSGKFNIRTGIAEQIALRLGLKAPTEDTPLNVIPKAPLLPRLQARLLVLIATLLQMRMLLQITHTERALAQGRPPAPLMELGFVGHTEVIHTGEDQRALDALVKKGLVLLQHPHSPEACLTLTDQGFAQYPRALARLQTQDPIEAQGSGDDDD